MRVVRRVWRVRVARVIFGVRREQRRREEQELVVRVDEVVEAVEGVGPRGFVDWADAGAERVVGYGGAEERVGCVRGDREGAGAERHEGVPVASDFGAVGVVRHVGDVGCWVRRQVVVGVGGR